MLFSLRKALLSSRRTLSIFMNTLLPFDKLTSRLAKKQAAIYSTKLSIRKVRPSSQLISQAILSTAYSTH